MNFKKKWQRFWTLNRHHDAGFTLVELIVVIAIMAILAGVAVPAYTGYIKRAHEAQDQLLIAAVNEAFAGGCLEAGVEVSTVTDAKISVSNQLIFGISSVEISDTAAADAVLNQISITFNQLFQGNFNTPLVTENVMSLDWVPEDHTFVMDHENAVPSRILLSSGKFFTVTAEDLAMIQASAYADMGYAEVAEIVTTLSTSSESLVSVAKGLGLGDRFSNVLVHMGLVSNAAEADGKGAGQVANGLQLVTGKYLAGLDSKEIAELASMEIGATFLGQDLGTFGVLKNLAAGDGGCETVSALATQYALAQAYGETEAGKKQPFKGTALVCTGTKSTFLGEVPIIKSIDYDCSSVEEFLESEAAQADPVWALKTIQASDGYPGYTADSQYTEDLNGFVGIMSILGNNTGTVENPGAIDINKYFDNGINSPDAKDALTGILGE